MPDLKDIYEKVSVFLHVIVQISFDYGPYCTVDYFRFKKWKCGWTVCKQGPNLLPATVMLAQSTSHHPPATGTEWGTIHLKRGGTPPSWSFTYYWPEADLQK